MNSGILQQPLGKTQGQASPVIMVVDDAQANLEMLAAMLECWGYRVNPVLSSELALQNARLSPPDLVLLDVNMPVMDGFELCKQFKTDERLTEIPIIFISGLNEVVDKVKGFAAGGVDYITKPFKFEEVNARVRTHLELARLRLDLKNHNARLEETVSKRTHELAQANARLAILDKAKSDFLTLISHEVRTPLCGVFGATELLLDLCADKPECLEYSEMYTQSRERLMRLIDDALMLTEIDAQSYAGEQKECSLADLMHTARSAASALAQNRGVVLEPTPAGLGIVAGDATFLHRALQCLLETAIKFSRSGNMVRLSQSGCEEKQCIIIEADGYSIPDAALPRFFDSLAIGETMTPGGDLGLAPALAERIFKLFGGVVSVENIAPVGIRLKVCLKRSGAATTY